MRRYALDAFKGHIREGSPDGKGELRHKWTDLDTLDGKQAAHADGTRATVLSPSGPSRCTQSCTPSAINSRQSSSIVDRTCHARLPSLPGAVNRKLTAVAVYIALANGRCAVAKFSKSRVWDKVWTDRHTVTRRQLIPALA